MSSPSLTSADLQTLRVRVHGRVQGVGLRPAVARLAASFSLAGSVANTATGIELILIGRRETIQNYLSALADQLPTGATIEQMDAEGIEWRPPGGFHILESRKDGLLSAPLPLDTVACDACQQEIRDPQQRRYLYPFTSCSVCGPRYSIIEAMPYDRASTEMRGFEMCPACAHEYRDSADRRYHAQTIACESCGPRISFVVPAEDTVHGRPAMLAAAMTLREGKILALKGLGGYQLLVDATSAQAVRRLRERKRRAHKPLAVLASSLAEACRFALLSADESRMLRERGGPIVVATLRCDSSLASEVALGLGSVGIMLPTPPLHALLCDAVGLPLVCTSGNREGEPLAYDNGAAEVALTGIADAFLHHDRPIIRPIDDSVVRIIAGEPCFLRLARGYAPHPLPLNSSNSAPIIALGGEQKAAIAMFNGAQSILGPHVGDLTNAAACSRWENQLASLGELYGVPLRDTELVHDAHPDYYTARWAQPHRRRSAVQHHHAHIAAVMVEHQLPNREVLGLAWDGTGYGDDGSIWGGECLLASLTHYRRVGWLRYLSLLGGEQAVREPWRLAVSLVGDALGVDRAAQLRWPDVPVAKMEAVLGLLNKPRLSPRASSMGRLFDGVAALVLGIARAFEEGRPAVLLEAACARTAAGEYSLVFGAGIGEVDWRPMIVEIVADIQSRVAPGIIAMRFHRAVARLAIRLADSYQNLPLVTGGGVFQNAVVVELMAETLLSRRGGWLRPRHLPPGDGGLAAGQLAIAMARRSSESS